VRRVGCDKQTDSFGDITGFLREEAESGLRRFAADHGIPFASYTCASTVIMASVPVVREIYMLQDLEIRLLLRYALMRQGTT
jgi:hypothetical protein